MNDLSRLSDSEVTDMLRRRSARPAPDGLASAVLESLASERARHPVRTAGRSAKRPLVLLAAAALLLVGGAMAAGSGLVRLPSLVPPVPAPSLPVAVTNPTAEPSPSPTVAPSPAPTETPAVVPPRAASWSTTGSMIGGAPRGPATLLLGGKVLVTGGYAESSALCFCLAQLYDPASGSWTATGNMINWRQGHTATLLRDGKVLAAGGSPGDASAELYDPGSGSWTATGSMASPRQYFTATLLLDGKVLVAGGFYDHDGRKVLRASAELYDPATGSWAATGQMIQARAFHTATLLPGGRVLVTGGDADDTGHGNRPLASAELYDPATGSWTVAGSMGVKRQGQTATLLPDGKILVVGGTAGDGGDGTPMAAAELYDPSSGTWTATGSMAGARKWFTATLLPDGKVLVAGGASAYDAKTGWTAAQASELYDPSSGTWTATASMVTSRSNHTAALLPDGKVLVVGGDDGASAELYDPGSP